MGLTDILMAGTCYLRKKAKMKNNTTPNGKAPLKHKGKVIEGGAGILLDMGTEEIKQTQAYVKKVTGQDVPAEVIKDLGQNKEYRQGGQLEVDAKEAKITKRIVNKDVRINIPLWQKYWDANLSFYHHKDGVWFHPSKLRFPIANCCTVEKGTAVNLNFKRDCALDCDGHWSFAAIPEENIGKVVEYMKKIGLDQSTKLHYNLEQDGQFLPSIGVMPSRVTVKGWTKSLYMNWGIGLDFNKRGLDCRASTPMLPGMVYVGLIVTDHEKFRQFLDGDHGGHIVAPVTATTIEDHIKYKHLYTRANEYMLEWYFMNKPRNTKTETGTCDSFLEELIEEELAK